MQRHRQNRTEPLSKQQKQADRRIRDKYAARPSLAELQASGDVSTPVKHGEFVAMMHFAAQLKSIRELLHMSLSDMAAKAGIDKAAVSRLENGIAENPTIATLERLARSVGKRIRIELEDDCPAG